MHFRHRITIVIAVCVPVGMRQSRRRFLGIIGSGGMVGLAGCGGTIPGNSASGKTTTASSETTSDESTTTKSEGTTTGKAGDASSGSTTNQQSSATGTTTNSPQNIEILNHSRYKSNSKTGVKGTLKNTVDKELPYVKVKVKFLRDGEVVGIETDDVMDLAGGKEWQFKTTYTGEKKFTDYKLVARAAAP